MSETLPPTPPVSIGQLASVLGNPIRWRLLAALASGEPLMVVELAEQLGDYPDKISKHMTILRKANLVVAGRTGAYRLRTEFVADPAERIVDLGTCQLRLKTVASRAAE